MDKLKFTVCFSCCFRGSDVDPLAHNPTAPAAPPDSSSSASMIRASSTWIRSRATELPERCGAIVSRIGKNAHQHNHQQQRRRHGSADFHYDPLSYALNFDDGPDFDDDETGGEPASPSRYRYRSFSSRLPQSPPMSNVRTVPVPTGEVACS